MLLVLLNLPMIGIWIRLLTVPYRLLFPAIITFWAIGLYTLNNNPFDIFVGAGFGLVGYVLHRLGCEPAPLILGFILGPIMEEYLRRALLLSRGEWSTFVSSPLSAGLLIVSAIALVLIAPPSIRRQRDEAFVED